MAPAGVGQDGGVTHVLPLARPLRRVAVLSMHTSPLDQPGTGDAGGLNVYVVELARRLAQRGVEVEVFTRATSSDLAPRVELAPGVVVRHVEAGPYEGLGKDELPAQLCAFTAGVLAEEARHAAGHYDLVHSHYWLSGQVGWVAAERWGVPLVHSAHTLAKVKNSWLADGDDPEPRVRVVGEQQVVDAADRLLAATTLEAAELRDLYGARPEKIAVVAPGVDLDVFRPGSRADARAALGLPADATVLAFCGRVQKLKAPDVLLRAAALLAADRSGGDALRSRLVVLVAGGASGDPASVVALEKLAASLGIADRVRFLPAVPRAELADVYRAADVLAVPSYSESFGLVAVEAQACGTPVVATDVGGLRTAVRDGFGGVLVDGHEPAAWADALRRALRDRARLSSGAVAHASRFGWERTASGVLDVYAGALADRRALAAAG
ncbi:MAG TPA: D-inositol-3-phosphate glycosyltransferase [Mycobacteriales bacterium]|nr:D-inositol-3-phosphate glycosyltransferase [Mycobacteriales bacterium]